MKLILSTFLILFLSSCSFFFKKVGGIRDPRFETHASIYKYAKTLEIDSADIVFTKDSASLSKIAQLFGGGPEILTFDHTGKYFPYKNDSVACNASIDRTLENICKISSNGIKPFRHPQINDLISWTADPNKTIPSSDSYDYIVFFNFSTYYDGINKTHILPWNKILHKKNDSCRVKYVFVNEDYMLHWGMSKNSLPHLKIKAF
ncbi:MAG: hypothetical protein H0U27_04715 [Nitrosopumilus sp.]|nr:hypothetical protein [Nitrosopumilus sp.]